MLSLLLVGFIIGMRHALEADHVAAVASMLNGRLSLAQAVRQGGIWGLGHTIALLLFGSIVILMDTVIPEQVAHLLEAGVGLMLVFLGLDVLRRLLRNQVHFHSHRHADGRRHFHAHSHQGESRQQHAHASHDHPHPNGFPLRALMVGLMHGMAGSAAVILLALNAQTSLVQGFTYLVVFGVGSILGMALLSIVISLPMRLSAARLNWAHNGLQAVAGVATIVIGVLLLLQNVALS